MRSLLSLIFSISLLAAVVIAQNSTQSINPNSVDLSQRSQWCLAELNSCPLLCGGQSQTRTNDCSANTLTYNCICTNGTSPDVAAYNNTLPFYVCQAYIAQCIKRFENDAQGQSACRSQNHCGSLNPSDVAPATPSASSTASTTSSPAPSATATSKGLGVSASQDCSMGILAFTLLAAFGLLL